MIKLRSKVRIKFSKLDLPEDILKSIREFDELYYGVHVVTNICCKNSYTDNKIKRYELDKEFMFYENELEEIE